MVPSGPGKIELNRIFKGEELGTALEKMPWQWGREIGVGAFNFMWMCKAGAARKGPIRGKTQRLRGDKCEKKRFA